MRPEDLTVLEAGPTNEEFTATLERLITWKMQPGLYCGSGVQLSLDPQHGNSMNHEFNLWIFDSVERDWICLHAALPFESIPENLPAQNRS